MAIQLSRPEHLVGHAPFYLETSECLVEYVYSKKKEGLFHMPTFFLMIIDDPGRALLDLRRDM